MAVKTQTLRFKRTVNAPPAEVYRAFTNSTALREWFADAAHCEPRPGGRVHFAWNQGYFATGEFTRLDPGRKVAFTWHGRGEPAPTRVTVSLAARNGGTSVTVAHGGVGSGKKWAATITAIEHGWESGLENLQSVLEVGQDLRFTLRPMLGISGLEELNADVAAKIGTPVTLGIRIDGTVAGMGAAAAGLQKNDVMVSLGGRKLSSWGTLVAALQRHRAGDQVPVVFYRGSEKHTVTMTLSRRLLPDVPPTVQALADAVRKIYEQTDAELAQCFEGVADEAASYRPSPDEWSAKESLAHLIIGERDTHGWITELVDGAERWYDTVVGNNLPRTRATAITRRTAAALLDELKQCEAETVALLSELPREFATRRGSYWRMGSALLQNADHAREHMDQIQAAIAAARQQ